MRVVRVHGGARPAFYLSLPGLVWELPARLVALWELRRQVGPARWLAVLFLLGFLAGLGLGAVVVVVRAVTA